MKKQHTQVNIRPTIDELRLIDEASALVHRNRSNFVIYATIGRAREILKGVVSDEPQERKRKV